MNKQIAIIGGSAAGLYSALLLARKRAQVKLFEASGEMGSDARTLIVTSRFKDLLATVGATVPTHEIHHFELFTDGRFATISLQDPDLVIERSALIHSLATQAQKAGVELLRRNAFQGLDGGGPVTVQDIPEWG